jgi:signal transduction histidine kinase
MRKTRSLNFYMVIWVFAIMVISGIMTGICVMILYWLNLLPISPYTPLVMPLITLFVSIVLGTFISTIVSRRILKPLNELNKATKVIAKGDFSIRVKELKDRNVLNELMKNFNVMAEELGSIEMFRQDFIDNFSHEFKTPIVSIRGFAKQLQKSTLTKEQRQEYTDIILKESERLTNMSSNILLLTKFENQQIVTDKKEFYLDEQIRTCILLLEKQWSKKNIQFNFELDEVKYYTNEEMLSHVWINLLSNAIKFSESDGEITVKCCKDLQNITIEISDSGKGIDSKVIGHIFDKFYQVESSHTGEGNGLGLAIAKRIVDLCHGEISVISEVGIGTTFKISLPLA